MPDFSKDWNPKIGLWTTTGHGHTIPSSKLKKVHAAPNAASKIVVAAQLDQLQKTDVPKILSAIRKMQDLSGGEKHGCLKWYWEEPGPVDTNAAFFTGLSLIVLRKQWYEKLTCQSRKTLEMILKDLKIWFLHAIKESSFYYPNKYLGDLVCGWMLTEITGDKKSAKMVADKMLKAADYWLDDGWGWGEHLSDGYTSVCLVELSVLLLCGEKLPEKVRKKYLQVAEYLLSIEDTFAGQPRVPALRSYAFNNIPEATNFRDRVKSWKKNEDLDIRNLPPFYNLFYELGWHKLFNKKRRSRKNISIPCYNNSKAVAYIQSDIRLGSMTRFPVMPAAEHPGWGLSWQCFPVAFYRRDSWGFLQWETKENDRVRCHPASDKAVGYLGNALSLSCLPPPVGKTYCLQRKDELLAVRIMTPVPSSWEYLYDRFKLIGDAGKTSLKTVRNWSQLLMNFPERQISINFVNPYGKITPILKEKKSGISLKAKYSGQTLSNKRMIVSIWGISLNGKVKNKPEIKLEQEPSLIPRNEEERVFELNWQWPKTRWHLRVDPLAENPLEEI